MNLKEIIENFEFLEDWDDKYIYIIDLGNSVPQIKDTEKTPERLVPGCQSRVWLVCDSKADDSSAMKLSFRADSDSQIVKGLVAIVLAIFNDKTPAEIMKTDPKEIFEKLQLESHLSGNRANGLNSMVDKIKEKAQIFLN